MKQKWIAVAGPTASGKTALAVCLARRIGGEIISMDSMQLYRRMEIGTAAPNEAERGGVPHHLVGIAEPCEDFSCAEYAARAQALLAEIAARGAVPIFCGGTGLYLESLLRLNGFAAPQGSQSTRAELNRFARERGAEALHARLAAVDPASAAAIHPHNVRRVVRALEIYEASGVTKTEWDRRSLAAEPKYDAQIVLLDFHSRELLYSRIDRRVDAMLDGGLEAEARALYDEGLLDGRTVAAQAIGYKEWIPYFRGETTRETVRESIAQATRRYAKRQLTWFRRYQDAITLYPDDASPLLSADALAEAAINALRVRDFL